MGLDAFLIPAISAGLGWWQQQQASNTLSPLTSAFQNLPNTSGVIEGGGYSSVPVGQFPDEIQDYLAGSGLGYFGTQATSADHPLEADRDNDLFYFQNPLAQFGPMGEAFGSTILQDSINEYLAELERKDDYLGGIEDFESSLEAGSSQIQGAIDYNKAQTDAGLGALEGFFDFGAGQLASASADSAQAKADTLLAIQQSLQDLTNEGKSLIGDILSTKEGALADHSDRTAAMLEGTTTGIQMQLAAQKAEINGRSDIPAAAKTAMSQRLEFMNASQLHSAVNAVWTSEGVRKSALLVSYDGMLANATTALISALGGATTSAIAGISDAVMGDAANQVAIATAAAELGATFGGLTTNFLTSMTTSATSLMTTLAAFELDGQGAILNMMANIPYTFLSLTGAYSQMISMATAVNEGDLAKSYDDFLIFSQQFNIETAVSQPYFQQAIGGALDIQQLANSQPDNPSFGEEAALAYLGSGSVGGGSTPTPTPTG